MARRMTSLLRSPLRIAALMICSSFSVGRKPMVAVMSTTIADVAQSYSNCSTHSGTPTPAFAASFLLDAINAPRVIAGRFASESVRFPAAAARIGAVTFAGLTLGIRANWHVTTRRGHKLRLLGDR